MSRQEAHLQLLALKHVHGFDGDRRLRLEVRNSVEGGLFDTIGFAI